MTHSVTLTFENHPLALLEMDGEHWIRGAQIALALGYKNPENAIKDLYARNEPEFTEHMTRVVELPTAGGVQQVRVFTLRGAHLLVSTLEQLAPGVGQKVLPLEGGAA